MLSRQNKAARPTQYGCWKLLPRRGHLNPTALPTSQRSSPPGLKQEKLQWSFPPSHSTACPMGQTGLPCQRPCWLTRSINNLLIRPTGLICTEVIYFNITSIEKFAHRTQEKHFVLKLPWAELRASCFSTPPFSKHSRSLRPLEEGIYSLVGMNSWVESSYYSWKNSTSLFQEILYEAVLELPTTQQLSADYRFTQTSPATEFRK